MRVYKNLWPSLRSFWLLAAKDHADKVYIVYEKQRYTYQRVFERSLRAAAVYRDYGVRKGTFFLAHVQHRQGLIYVVLLKGIELPFALVTILSFWLHSGLVVCLPS
jgi:non-ribosomal peptide synthetase component F